MKLTDYCIQKPVTVLVGVILVVMFGLLGLLTIPVQLTPDVERPTINVRTVWRGGSPVEVEREIVDEQEDKLKAVEGLIEMTSQSRDGRGDVALEFEVGVDHDAALLKTQNKLQQVPTYPDDADRPVLVSGDEQRDPMAYFIVKALPGRTVPINHDFDFFENYVQPRLERIPGVASINIYGGREREMQVIADPQRLAARGVTISELINAISAGNNNTSAGDFDEGKRNYIVRTVGEYKTARDIEQVVIKYVGDDPIFVRDVARAQLAFKKRRYAVRNKGAETMIFNAVRASGANVLETMQNLQDAISELNNGILADKKLTVKQVYDESTYIESALELVKNNLYLGSFLAATVLLLFLRSIPSTLIIAASIPITVVGTFFLMTLFGRNINVISLGGMAFAVGMVVDAAIVVLENIYRHRESGETRFMAASRGTGEVWGAVLASTLTTIAVFGPIIYIKEEAGQLFRDIAIAISSAVFLSLIVSITVIPMLSSRLLRIRKRLPVPSSAAPRKRLTKVSSMPGALLHNFTYWVSGRVWARLLIILVLTSAAILMAVHLSPKAEYLPEGNRDTLFAIILPPPGYNVDQFENMAEVIEKELAPYWSAAPGSPEAAALDAPPVREQFFFARGQNAGMGVSPYPEDAHRIKELRPVIQRAVGKIPGLITIIRQPSLFGRGARRSINVEITGPDLSRVIDLADGVYQDLKVLLPEAQMRPIPGLDMGNPEIRVIPDRGRLAETGLTPRDLGTMVNMLLDGLKVSEFRYEGENLDLTVMAESGRIKQTQDLAEIQVGTPTQGLISIGSVADVELIAGPVQINHIERQRAVTVQVIPPETMPLQTAMEKIQDEVVIPMKQKGELGGAYRIKLAGTADKLTQTRSALSFNFLLALAVTYLLMAALFESFVYPFVILFSVPLAAAGGFLGLAAVNKFIAFQPLDVLTMLGFVILVGIVVNNAILIVHQSLNNIRFSGMNHKEAAAESVRTRLRPIFMSTATSVFGMAPLVLFPGAGSELYRGLGGVVIGGLAVSTFFTIFLVPALFTLVLEIQKKLGRDPKPSLTPTDK